MEIKREPLGSGATANVCLCERDGNKQQVVLKILKGEGSGDSDLLARFVQEYFATSSIDSPASATDRVISPLAFTSA